MQKDEKNHKEHKKWRKAIDMIWGWRVERVQKVEVAEWSKAVDSGSIPKGRGFKSHLQHFFTLIAFSFILILLNYNLY